MKRKKMKTSLMSNLQDEIRYKQRNYIIKEVRDNYATGNIKLQV